MQVGISRAKRMWMVILLGLGLTALGALCFTAWSTVGAARADGTFNVGFTVLDFTYPDGRNEKTLSVAVWYPTRATPNRYNYGGPTNGTVALNAAPYRKERPYPLLVFSHGYGGSGLSAVFLTEHLAAKGWIVAAPDHQDRYSAVRIRTGHQEGFDRAGFLRYGRHISNSEAAHRGEYLYRLDEMKLVLDRMFASEQFGRLIDKERIAVGGHSLGGFTALGLCGTIEERRDDRIKAVLLFSTGAGGYLFTEKELARVKIPSMVFLGERERDQKRGSETMKDLSGKVYRNVQPPKYFLEVRGANHFSFNNRFTDKPGSWLLSGSEEQFEVIRRYSIAFLEQYVAGRGDAGGVLGRQDPLVTRTLSELPREISKEHEQLSK